MDPVITSISEIQVGDILKLMSHLEITRERPYGKRLRVKLRAHKFSDSLAADANINDVMSDPELNTRFETWIHTQSTNMLIKRITRDYILMDILRTRHNELDEPYAHLQHANVIVTHHTFNLTFLQNSHVFSCYIKHSHNPRSRHLGRGSLNPNQPEEEPFNPSGHIGTNKYLVSRVY